MSVKILAISTDFKHHGNNQLLKGIKLKFTLVINEQDATGPSTLQLDYPKAIAAILGQHGFSIDRIGGIH